MVPKVTLGLAPKIGHAWGVDAAEPVMKFTPLLALIAACLSGCASIQRIDAAADVHALLIAIRDNDQAAFDARIDRPALRAQIESQLVVRARQAKIDDRLKGLAMLLAGPAAQVASDTLLRPSVFKAAAEYYGYTPNKPIPGQLAIAASLRQTANGRVCAAKSKTGPCLLSFASEEGVWKLVSFDGDPAQLKLPNL
jgi:hypothetical protein